jgi:hypothetical protein
MYELFRPGDDIWQRRSNLVEFARRELGIVGVVDALIPESSTNLEDLILPA